MIYLNDHIQEMPNELIAEAIGTLPEWRREKVLSIKFPQGQRECALSYVELCRGLRQEYGICEKPAFAFNEHGKPSLKEHPDIHFSLSHCKTAVACLISSAECGIDVECIRTAKPSLVHYCMNEDECERIFASPLPDLTFIHLWTQKEAVYKLLGTGLQDGVKDILHPRNLQGIELQTIENPYKNWVMSTAVRLQE